MPIMCAMPLYAVINRDLSDQIAAGTLAAGDRLLSESQLAERYGVSRMTVRQALSELESSGLVVRRHGLGTFVSEVHPPERRANRLGSFAEELGVDASVVSTRVLAQEVVLPPDDVRVVLQPGKGQKTVRIYRLRLVHGTPVALQQSWLPFLSAPALAREELVDGSLYATLRQQHGIEIVAADQRVTAAAADADQAALLGVEPGSALIHISRTSYGSSGEVVELAESVTVPTFPIAIHLERHDEAGA